MSRAESVKSAALGRLRFAAGPPDERAGGFMFFYCPGVSKVKVARAIEPLGGKAQSFKFTQQGLVTWTL